MLSGNTETYYEPYIYVDQSGTTKYTGTSQNSNNGGVAVWKIKKEWKVGNVTLMGFPNGSQDFIFIWNNRVGYTYK
jgi:hypothetical protein